MAASLFPSRLSLAIVMERAELPAGPPDPYEHEKWAHEINRQDAQRSHDQLAQTHQTINEAGIKRPKLPVLPITGQQTPRGGRPILKRPASFISAQLQQRAPKRPEKSPRVAGVQYGE